MYRDGIPEGPDGVDFNVQPVEEEDEIIREIVRSDRVNNV